MMLAPAARAARRRMSRTIRERYGDLADAFLQLYPAADYQARASSRPRATRSTAGPRSGWRASRRRSGQPAYLYLFDHGYPAMDEAGPARLPRQRTALSCSARSTARRRTGRKIPDTPAERALSDAMLDYWTSFARDGTPGGAKARRPGPPMARPADYHALRATRRRPRRELMPGMFALNEDGDVPPPRDRARPAWNWNVGLTSPKLPPRPQGCGSSSPTSSGQLRRSDRASA